jgi:hypothetical protein
MAIVTVLGIALQMASLGRDERLSPEHLLHELAMLTARRLPGCCATSMTVWNGGRVLRSSVSHADLAALRVSPGPHRIRSGRPCGEVRR